jgi:methionyl-tRNA synthetase
MGTNIGKILLSVLKPVIVMQLQKVADDITPEDIEEKLDIDGLFHKLENDPKYAEIAPLLKQIEDEGEEFQRQLAILLDAILDVAVEYIASKI